MFEALGITGSGMQVHKTWMDAISDNIANVNTARPTSQQAFQTRYVVAQSVEGGEVGQGVQVGGIALSSGAGKLVYDPTNPLADSKGLVRMPDVDLGEQMTTMIMAQRGYEANIAVVDRAKEAYQAALDLGKS